MYARRSLRRFLRVIFRADGDSGAVPRENMQRDKVRFDVAVVGGGVVGALTARELKKYALSVAVLEAADDVAAGASKANSGIVHAGFDALPGTLKAKYNVAGNAAMEGVCCELGVPFARCGSLVVARSGEEAGLEALSERGRENGVEGLEIVGRDRLLQLEPHIAQEITAALYAPTGGIVCPYALTIAAMGNAMDNGAQLLCGFEVTGVQKSADGWRLASADGREVSARIVVNCAGAGAERVAALFGDTFFHIGLRRGEYMLLDKSVGTFARHTVFSLPTKAGKGVLVTPTADGNLLVGPTSVEDGAYSTAVRREAFGEIVQRALSMLADIPFGQVITSFAGERAYSDRHDFILEWGAEGVFHAAGIESPGLTASPAIARDVAAQIAGALGAKGNAAFDPFRRSAHWFRELSREEKNAVIAQDPAYGKIVCRCEEVTLGEILDAMRQNPPARTLDGVKLRTRAGMGRCQSGFCQPAVFNELMREWGMTAEQVTKNGKTSFIIAGGEI